MTRQRPSGPVVLIVDDDEYVHRTLTAALRGLKPDIVGAWNAAEGQRLARKHHPDLAIIDIGLPDADGYRLASTMRADTQLDGLRIIILTGHVPDDAAAGAAGADAIVGKPFRVQDLVATVSRLLQEGSAAGH